MEKNDPPGFEYPEFAPMFKAELFDPNAWAELFQKAGARWAVCDLIWPNCFTPKVVVSCACADHFSLLEESGLTTGHEAGHGVKFQI